MASVKILAVKHRALVEGANAQYYAYCSGCAWESADYPDGLSAEVIGELHAKDALEWQVRLT